MSATIDLFSEHQWKPFTWLGLTHPFFSLEADTLFYTWISLGIIALLTIAARICLLHYPDTMAGYSIKWTIRMFMKMVTQSCKHYEYRYVSFFLSLFIFLLICNCLIIIPTMEEPTKDLNTTLALSIITFFFIQAEAVRVHGLIAHLNEFFKTPFAVSGVYPSLTPWSLLMLTGRILLNTVIGIAFLPIELMGKLSNVISLSFRLFGNILAGSVISSLWLKLRSGSLIWQLAGLATGLNILITLFFGVFEGTVQAFVFIMLGLSYLSRALQHH
jgi:F-type H+-transporting ATPase subunit a